MQREGLSLLRERVAVEATEEVLHLGWPEDVLDALLPEALRLHLEELAEQPVDLFFRAGFDQPETALFLEFAELEPVFFALALAAGAFHQLVEAAFEIDRQ